jgi:hypothetical protein
MVTLASSGCVGLGQTSTSTAAFVDIDRPELRGFAVASMTDMERDVRLETGTRKRENITPPLFWTGIAVGSIATAGAVTFGVLGFTTKRDLQSGYEGDGLTVDERDDLVSRGQTFNSLTVAMTTIAVLGYALALVTYGVDWNTCGPLARKREARRCPVSAD